MFSFMFYLYILQNEKDKGFYVGHSQNIKERLKRHNEGRSGYTKGKGNWKLVYLEEYPTKAEAMSREKEVKEKKSRKYIEFLVRMSR